MTRRNAQSGFTLIEVLVALSIFALIGTAGFSMLDQVLRTQRQTEGRLETLGQMQRAMYLITQDFTQARGTSLAAARSGESGPTAVAFRRSAPEAAEGVVDLEFALQDGTLQRRVSRPNGDAIAHQPLLQQVSAIGWRFYDRDTGWVSDWPPPGWIGVLGQRPPNPQAVELTISLVAQGRQLRRIALLPGEP